MKKKGYAKGGLKPAPNKGAASLPKGVRNKMGFMNKGGMAKKKKGYAKGGMTKKGYAMGGIQTSTGGKYEPASNRAAQGMMSGRGMASGMGMAKGGMPKKKAYAKGGKVAMYNQGGMVKNTSTLNTGLKKGK